MKQNKYPKFEVIEPKKFIVFSWKWIGNRTPEFVIFPSGKKTKVSYMKDGDILFEDGSSGTYQRTCDDKETMERIIILKIEE